MDSVDVRRLWLRAGEIMDVLGVYYSDKEAAMCFADRRIERFEHLVHELAHAALCRVKFQGPKLSKRTGKSIDRRSQVVAEIDECLTFSIESLVFERFGLPWDWKAAQDAVAIQLTSRQVEVHDVWKQFEHKPQRRRFADQIVRFLLDSGVPDPVVS